MRSILVPVADRPECVDAMRVSFDLAQKLSANVMGLHVRPHDKEQQAPTYPVNAGVLSYPVWLNSISDEEIHLNSKAAAKLFHDQAGEYRFKIVRSARFSDAGGLGVWHEMKGGLEKVFSIAGPMSDLIVVSRPRRKNSQRARAFMLSALMYSARPVLILPHRKPKQPGSCIAIAWNQSTEAMAAVVAAMPLLQRAESVHIVSAGKENRIGPKSHHLQQYLKYWNVQASCEKTPGESVETELVDWCADRKTDLLVMGAYSRSARRERIFGSVTDYVLNETKLAAFMLHP